MSRPLTFSRNYNHGPTCLALTVWVTLQFFIQIFMVGSVKRFSARVRIDRSSSSKVIDFGTNQKRVCDFLLVRHSCFGPILHRFRILQVFVPMTSSLFHPNFGGIPVAPDRRCWGQPEQKPKRIRHEIIFEVF